MAKWHDLLYVPPVVLFNGLAMPAQAPMFTKLANTCGCSWVLGGLLERWHFAHLGHHGEDIVRSTNGFCPHHLRKDKGICNYLVFARTIPHAHVHGQAGLTRVKDFFHAAKLDWDPNIEATTENIAMGLA